MSSHYKIYIFTARSREQASPVMDYFNKKKTVILDLLSGEDCLVAKSNRYIKDLRIVENRGLKDMVLVDNFITSFALQLSNGVPISEFRGSKKDRELIHLGYYLARLSHLQDVRSYNTQHLKLEDLAQKS